jgi:hypothetical protein
VILGASGASRQMAQAGGSLPCVDGASTRRTASQSTARSNSSRARCVDGQCAARASTSRRKDDERNDCVDTGGDDADVTEDEDDECARRIDACGKPLPLPPPRRESALSCERDCSCD